MHRTLNTVKTAGLLGLLFGLILGAGYLLGGGNGLLIALVLGGVMNVGAWFFSDTIAIQAMRGQEVDANTAPQLHAIVRRLAARAGLPTPRVYICPQEAPNAFATGRSPSHAAVAVTQGALRLLDEHELEGVLGHELAHVKNRDTLTSTIAAVIAGAISYLGWIFMFGGDRDVNPFFALLFIILAPFAAALIQMAISRTREYDADALGAEIAGTPDGLAQALLKLESYAERIPLEGEMPAQNHMFIVQPLSGSKTLASLFSTHPPTEDRVRRLRAMRPHHPTIARV